MSFPGSGEDVLQQVDHFWSILDDLSENDPEGYRKFIQKQMKEGAEFSAPPELHSCLCTEMLEPKKGLLYVNICSWKRVPAPQDPSKPLPLCAGKLETDTDPDHGQTQSFATSHRLSFFSKHAIKDKADRFVCFSSTGLYTVLDVAFNPAVLRLSGKDKIEKNQVYTLVLSYAHQQHGIRLSQQYSVLSHSPKSSPDDLHRRFGFQHRPSTSKVPETASQTPAALLQQISSLRSEKQDEEPAAQIICRPAEQKKTDLIQVISTTFVQPQTPEYQLEVKTDPAGSPLSLELTVELPKVCSMSECQLSISKNDVLLEVEDFYHLLLEFPNTVNEDTAAAIFNKKKRRLTLRVDVL